MQTTVTTQGNNTTNQQNEKIEKLQASLLILKKKIINTGMLIARYEETQKKLDSALVREQELMKHARNAVTLAQLHKATLQQLETVKKENEEWHKKSRMFNESQKEIDSLRNQLQHKTVMLNNQKSDSDRMKSEIQSEKNANIKLKSKIAELEHRVAERHKELLEKDLEFKQLKRNWDEVKGKITTNQNMEHMLESAQSELESARNEISRLRSQDPALYQRTTSTSAEIHKLNLRLNELESENSSIRSEYQQLEQKQQDMESKYKEKLADLRKENRRAARSAPDDSISSMNDELKKDNQRLVLQNEEMRKRVRELEFENNRQQMCIDQLQSDVERSTTHQVTADPSCEQQLRSQIEALSQELNNQKKLNHVAAKQMTNKERVLQKQVEALQSQLSQQQKDHAKMAERFTQEKNNLLNQLQTTKQTFSKEVSHVSEPVFTNGYAMIIQENESLRSRCASLEQQIVKIRSIFMMQVQPLLFIDGTPSSNHTPVNNIPGTEETTSTSVVRTVPTRSSRDVALPAIPSQPPVPSPSVPVAPVVTTRIENELSAEPELGGEIGFGGDEVSVMDTEPPEVQPAMGSSTRQPPATQKISKKRKLTEINKSATTRIDSTKKKRRVNEQTQVNELPVMSFERRTQEKTETFVQRLLTTYMDTYFDILFKSEPNNRLIQKTYRIAANMCATIWQICHGSLNSSIGSHTAVRSVVKGLSETLVHGFILKRTDGKHLELILNIVKLLHLHSPINADIFAQMFEILQSHIFPIGGKHGASATLPQKELEALCAVTSILSQIDVRRTLPPRRVNNKRALKVVAIAKPFSLEHSLRVLCFDLLCSVLSHKKEDGHFDVDRFKLLFALVSGNRNLVQSNNFVGKTIMAILKQILMELEEKSATEGLVQWEQQLQTTTDWILKALELQPGKKKKLPTKQQNTPDDHVDHIVEKLLSGIRTLSFAGLHKKNNGSKDESLLLSAIEQDLIQSFTLVAHYRDDWQWLHNELYRNSLWPLAEQEGALTVVLCVMGMLCMLRVKGALVWTQQSNNGGVKEMLHKLLLVIHPDASTRFSRLAQLCAVDYLAEIVSLLNRSGQEHMIDAAEQQLVFDGIVRWLDRNMSLKDDKQLSETFSRVAQLFIMMQQTRNTVVAAPAAVVANSISDSTTAAPAGAEDALDEMCRIRWKR